MINKKVLIYNISNLSEARFCAGMGVSHVAFALNPKDECFIGYSKIAEIKNWLSGVEIGGICTDDNMVSKDIENLELDFLVYPSNLESPVISQFEGYFIKEFKNISDFIADPGAADLRILKLESNELADYKPVNSDSVFILTDWNTENLALLGNLPHNLGIAIRGSSEERPGFLNYNNTHDILEFLDDLE